MIKKRGNKNRAQVSVFVILAVVIVAIGAGVYFLKKPLPSESYFENQEIKQKVNNIKESARECMKQTTLDSLDIIGMQGGYYKKPNEAFDLGYIFIPYYYYEGRILVPSKKTIENELADYVDGNLERCIDMIDNQGFDISYTDPKTKSSISNDEVLFYTDMTLTIKKESKSTTYEFKKEKIIYKSKFSDFLEIAEYISDSLEKNSSRICITCINDMAENKKIHVEIMDFSQPNTSLFIFSENVTNPEINIFEFLNKYE